MLPKTSKHLSNSRSQNHVAGVSRGVGGGGWIAPKSSSRPKQFNFDNSFGRYGGGRELYGRHRSMKLFGESGTNSFGVGTGVGFAGRAHSGLASMEAYHRYKQYKSMMKYKI